MIHFASSSGNKFGNLCKDTLSVRHKVCKLLIYIQHDYFASPAADKRELDV